MKVKKYLALIITLVVFTGVLWAAKSKKSKVIESSGRPDVLTGLRGVLVETREVDFGIKRKVGLTEKELQANVESQLQSKGITVFSKDEVFRVSGRPHLSIQLNIGVINKTVYYSMGICLKEDVSIFRGRKPTAGFVATTWQKNTVSITTESSAIKDIKKSTKYLVESFCDEYLAANPKVRIIHIEDLSDKVVDVNNQQKCLQ